MVSVSRMTKKTFPSGDCYIDVGVFLSPKNAWKESLSVPFITRRYNMFPSFSSMFARLWTLLDNCGNIAILYLEPQLLHKYPLEL